MYQPFITDRKQNRKNHSFCHIFYKTQQFITDRQKKEKQKCGLTTVWIHSYDTFWFFLFIFCWLVDEKSSWKRNDNTMSMMIIHRTLELNFEVRTCNRTQKRFSWTELRNVFENVFEKNALQKMWRNYKKWIDTKSGFPVFVSET